MESTLSSRISDSDCSPTRLRLRQFNRQHRVQMQSTQERIDALEAERDTLGKELDDALKAVALMKFYLEQYTREFSADYEFLLTLRGYRLAERVCALHGASALETLLEEPTS